MQYSFCLFFSAGKERRRLSLKPILPFASFSSPYFLEH